MRSDAEEDLPLVHPEQEKPVSQHDGDAEQERFKPRPEDLKNFVAEVNVEAADDEVFPKMRDEVCSNGIHAYDNQGEGPSAVVLDINDPGECDKKKEADASAEECPAWGPYALYDGADSCEVKQQSGGQKSESGDEESAQWDRGG